MDAVPRDSNSTRTESNVAIRPYAETQAEPRRLKTTLSIGCHQIGPLNLEMEAGLKSQEAVARASIEVDCPKVATMTLLSWPDPAAEEDDLGNWSPPLARKKGGACSENPRRRGSALRLRVRV